MARVILGKRAVAAVHAVVHALFERTKARLLARRPPKEIRISVRSTPLGIRPDLSIPGIFNTAAHDEGFRPADNVRDAVTRVAEGYLDAHRELAKVQVVNSVQNWLTTAETNGVDTDMETVLGGELMELMGKVTANVKKVVETEATRARNHGTLDVITKIAAVRQDQDPLVYFVIVRDTHVCSECTRLHQLSGSIDGPPKVYRLSEVGHGYHRRGEDSPKSGGLHPHCRCTMVYLPRGFGFDGAGKAAYVGPDHDEYQAQRGINDE